MNSIPPSFVPVARPDILSEYTRARIVGDSISYEKHVHTGTGMYQTHKVYPLGKVTYVRPGSYNLKEMIGTIIDIKA